jgi:hypothetical protein
MLFDSKKSEVALIIDVGNGSVGGALTVLTHGAKPNIIFSLRDVFAFDDKPTADKLSQAVLQSLETILSELFHTGFAQSYFKNHSKKIDTIVCVFSSPWFISQGQTIVISQNKNFVITDRFLKNVITKELDVFRKNTKENFEEGIVRRMIEADLVSIRVNGYIVKNPIGQKVNHLEASLYISEADDAFVKSIEQCILKHTHAESKDIIFRTFPSVAFGSISELFAGIPEYLHFDVAGEITDIALVKDGMIKKTVSYPTGTNLLLRMIGKKLSVPNQVARSYFHLFMDKRAEPTIHKQILEILAESENEWNVYLNDGLISLSSTQKTESMDADLKNIQPDDADAIVTASPASSTVNLPKKIFVTAYPRTFELFNQFLQMEKTDETGSWRNGISVTYVGADLLKNFVDSNMLQVPDPFLMLESFFLSKQK